MGTKTANDDLPIGQALRLLRIGLEITQTNAGKRGGADFRTISHWETGRKMPSLRLLVKYLKSLGLDLHDLQTAIDQLINAPRRLVGRLDKIEQRLGKLERWRLEMAAGSMPQEGDGPCKAGTSKKTSTAS